MELYYRDFLLFAGETNGFLREKLLMENEERAGEKEYREGAKLLRAFILSRFDYSRIHYFDDEELERKRGIISKTMLQERYSCFPLEISEERKAFFLNIENDYRGILFPSDFDAWYRIKEMGERTKWSELKMEASILFNTEELFLDKESYLKLFDALYLSCVE